MQNLIRVVFLFITPLSAFLLLLAITYIKDESFDIAYFIFGAMAFAFLFPGRTYFNESIQQMVSSIAVKWITISFLILLIGNISQTIDLVNKDTLLDWIISTPFIIVTVNEILRIIVNRIFTSELNQKRAIIVGCSPTGLRLGNNFKKNKIHGSNLLGYFDDRNHERIGIKESDLIGDILSVVDFCKREMVDEIYICIPLSGQPRIIDLLDKLKDTTSSIYFVPNIFITDLIQSKISHVDGIPVVAICETPLTGLRDLEKRIIDVILSTIILILFSPILLWVAYKVKHSSPGPIIFVQKRYGLDGKGIDVYKFRTMTVTEDGAGAYTQVQKNDARVTKIGEFLRKSSLDEFPQFVNVLQGRMSIVGPRPHVVAVNENYRKLIPGYMIRHKVKPGITGLAQVNGFRGGDDLEHMQGRIEYDLEYLKQWSVSLDLWIIFKTVLMILLGDKKAY